MIRNSLNLNFLAQNQKYVLSRVFSAQPAVAKKSSKLKEGWAAAKPFDQVPKLSKFEMVRGFLPGGKYYNISLLDIHKKLIQEYGNLVIMPGIFGRDPIMMSFDSKDFEIVFRNESIWPYRKNLETLEYYRNKLRPDIYAEHCGLSIG